MNMRNYAFGAGCGAVSALLFAVIATSSPLAFPLYLVAPLPILIATLGFTHLAGLSAALVASAAHDRPGAFGCDGSWASRSPHREMSSPNNRKLPQPPEGTMF